MELKRILKNILKENESLTFEELKAREIDIQALLNLKSNKIITFTGFRRAGKTSLMQLTAKALKGNSFLFFNFEDERLPESSEVLTQLMVAIEEMYPNRPEVLFLDEIHIMPGWSKFLFRIMKTGYRIFISGSSSKLGVTEIPTELRGRTLNREIYPLNFREYLGFLNISTDISFDKQRAVVARYFAQYLDFGGFPELVESSELERREVIQEYYRTLVQRDIIERFNVRNVSLFEATIKLLLNSLSVSISKLTKTLKSMGYDCSKNTIANYITYLGKTYFLHQAFYYSNNVKDQMQYPRKIYFIDTGFIRFLSLNPDAGRGLENLVAIELRRRGYDLYYWKNAKGEEVDFLLVKDQSVKELIQVCYSMISLDTREREIKGLIKAMKHFGLEKGVILTVDSEETIHEGKFTISVIPVMDWLLGGN